MVISSGPGTQQRRPGDQGSILVLTLMLTVVLAAIVLALAAYATTGLASSHVTTDRVAATSAASAAVQWEIEEYTHKRDTPCSTVTTLSPPSGVAEDVTSVTLRCVPTADVDGNRAAILEATASAGGGDVTVTALVQVPRYEYVTNVIRWTVD